MNCTDDACQSGVCANTPNDANCPDDGLYCNGIETCDGLLDCVSSGDPCDPGQTCDEVTETCADCADILYVDKAVSGGAGDGSSWADAYIELQTALANASIGDCVWVAQGTYYPDIIAPFDDRTATFQLLDGVTIEGGYPTGGGSRDIAAYETILSGDMALDAYHVTTGSGTGATAILDGVTITGGRTGGFNDQSGGGMLNDAGSPTVANCLFVDNGGTGGGLKGGGGMANFNASAPLITNCVFQQNWVAGTSFGGGMYNRNSSPTLVDCKFIDNDAVAWGGGLHNREGGDPVLVNCLFVRNTASGTATNEGRGGGFYNAKTGSSPTLTNCTFYGNSASGTGADGGGGGLYTAEAGSSLTLVNCILWNNSDVGGTDESAQVHANQSTVSVNYSCLEGWTGGLGGSGNTGGDPQFVNPASDDFRLYSLAGSACVDQGDNTAPSLAGITTDLAGGARFVDDPATTDGGSGTPPIVDMGAYEYFPDCNTNGIPDATDIAQSTSQDCDSNGTPDECDIDCNTNGVPDACDIASDPGTDCNNNGILDQCEEILGAISNRVHGGSEVFGVNLLSNNVEPRINGTDEIEVQLVWEPGSVDDLNVSAACTPTTYAGSITPTLAGNTVTLAFSTALPDESKCDITLDCNTSLCVRKLGGDSNQDGAVNPVDNNMRLIRFGQALGQGNFTYDFNVDGAINPVDNNQTLLRFGNSAPVCP